MSVLPDAVEAPFADAANAVLADAGRAPIPNEEWDALREEGFDPTEAALFHMACTQAVDTPRV